MHKYFQNQCGQRTYVYEFTLMRVLILYNIRVYKSMFLVYTIHILEYNMGNAAGGINIRWCCHSYNINASSHVFPSLYCAVYLCVRAVFSRNDSDGSWILLISVHFDRELGVGTFSTLYIYIWAMGKTLLYKINIFLAESSI